MNDLNHQNGNAPLAGEANQEKKPDEPIIEGAQKTGNSLIHWTEFKDKSGATKYDHEGSWSDLIQRLRTVGTFPDKSRCPWIKVATFGGKKSPGGSLRSNENVLLVYGVEGDYDGEVISISAAKSTLESLEIKAAFYPSPSSTVDKPRWRVICPLSAPCKPDARNALVARLNGVLDGVLAHESFTLSQGYFFGATQGNDYRVETTFDDAASGTCIDLLHDLDRNAIGKKVVSAGAQLKVADDDLFVSVVSDETIDDLRSALAFLPSDDRTVWINFGHALKTLGERGRDLWIEWSEKSDKYDPQDAADKWESFKPKQTSYQSVFAQAQAAGWINPKSKASIQLEIPIYANNTRGLTQRLRAKGFEFVSAAQMLGEPKPVVYLIDELIEHEALALLFAPPSAGKSFCAIGWACCVATGTPWLGRETTLGSVFYLAGEGHAGLSRRLKAWELHSGHELTSASLFVSSVPATLMNLESVKSVISAIEELISDHGKPALIVIDTFARNMGDGDESSNKDVGIFINHIDLMRYQLGSAIVLVHHSGHGDSSRGRGASALPAAMDACFQLEDKGDSICLSQKKSKEAENIKPMFLKLMQVSLPDWLDAKGRTLTSAVVVEAELRSTDLGKLPGLTKQQQLAVESYTRAAESISSTEVSLDQWRLEFNRTATQDNESSRDRAFKRARDELVKSNRMKIENGVYRLIGAAGDQLAAGFFDDLSQTDIADTT